MMPEIRNLLEFRAELAKILDSFSVGEKIGELQYKMMKIEISGLALDYADDFYRDALRLKSKGT